MQNRAESALRAQLLAELSELEMGDVAGAGEQATVTLDQQSVGRLSRMDALQRQALAQATRRRREARRARIKAALARMDEGDFGFCDECGEEIAEKRLALDPTVSVCIECAGAR